MLSELARRHGFDLRSFAVLHPGTEQAAAWSDISYRQTDYVILWGWGPAMTHAALKGARSHGFPVDRLYGGWWSGSELDVSALGEAAVGFQAVAMQHGAGGDALVVKSILGIVHAAGQGTGPRHEVGNVLYMRGVMSAMLGLEGIRTAQERFGIGQVMNGAQVRWGLENLYLAPARLAFLGFDGVMQPIVTSCADHMGSGWARIQTWRGKAWQFTTGWLQADLVLIRAMLRARAPQSSAGAVKAERTAFDCRS